jgi:hypothetical protein
MSDLIDFAGINSAALARGRNFLAALIPGGKFRGLEYIVRNPRRDDRQAGRSRSTIARACGKILPRVTAAAI